MGVGAIFFSHGKSRFSSCSSVSRSFVKFQSKPITFFLVLQTIHKFLGTNFAHYPYDFLNHISIIMEKL